MVNRAGMVTNAEAQIERNLQIIGSTAIEDRLQDGVPACIAKLAKVSTQSQSLSQSHQASPPPDPVSLALA